MSPSAAHRRAVDAQGRLIAPGAGAGERLQAGADLLLDTAGLAAFPVALGRLGRPASEVSQELMLGFSASPQAAGRQLAAEPALPPRVGDELAPPPQRIDVALPPATANEDRLDELLEWNMQTAAMRRGEIAGDLSDWMRGMDQRVMFGEFDDIAPEALLREDLRRMMDDEAFGFNSPEALRLEGFNDTQISQYQDRLQRLEQRFPDEVQRWDNENFGPDAMDFDPPDVDLWGQAVVPEPTPPAQITAYGAPDPQPPDAWQQYLNLPDDAPVVRGQTETALPYLYGAVNTQQPLTWLDQGLAGLYSRTERAAGDLRQPVYTDLEQLRAELRNRGAGLREMEWQLRPVEDLFGLRDGPNGLMAQIGRAHV
jgi:hypothetical protein